MQKKFVIEGAGIFDSIGNFFTRIFSGNAAQQLSSAALQAGKTVDKDIGMKTIDVGKTVAIDAGKKLVEKAATKLSTPKLQVANSMVPPEEITKKVNKVIAKYVDTSEINLNKLIDGSSVNRPTASNAIAIQHIAKRFNGSRLKVASIFFLLLLKMMADILKFTDTPIIDECIEEYEYNSDITAVIKTGANNSTGTSLNNGGDIRISIESKDVFTYPSESYLIFEGRLTKAGGTAYANADEVALTNNAIMHLFRRIEYHLSNQMIESLNYPMLGLLKYPDDFSMAQGLNHFWYKDTATTAAKVDNNGFTERHAYLIQSPTVKGTFSFRIPMKHIFGFCEDYDKIVYGLKHSLTLVRKIDGDAIFRGAAAVARKVSLDKMSWFMPHVIPADAEKFSIYMTIQSKVKMPVASRTRQCDMLSVPESTSFTWRLSAKQLRRNRDISLLVSKRLKMAIKLKIHSPSIM